MKNLVRALSVALALTGAVASTHASISAKTVASTRVNTVEVPTCPPNRCSF